MDAVLDYNKFTGIFTWKISPRIGIKKGDIAGTINKDGYVVIGYHKKSYYAHRLALGVLDKSKEVDHIDGDRSNNKLSNLRIVSSSENSRNSSRRIDNTSGCTGVQWRKSRNRWQAIIYIDGRKKSFGSFKTKDEAIIARKEAEKNNNYHANHDKIQLGGVPSTL